MCDHHDDHHDHGPDDHAPTTITRREMLETMGKAAAASLVAVPIVESAVGATAAQAAPLTAIAGPDRVTVVTGRTYLNGYAGYGPPPRRGAPRRPAPGAPPTPPPEPPGPTPKAAWTKVSGPGTVAFADPAAPVTTARFSAPGAYALKLTLDNGDTRVDSALNVKVVPEPKLVDLLPIYPRSYRVDSPLWNRTVKTLIVNWIPHCIDQINRTDLKLGPGGIDNFVEAAKALGGQPHGAHKGYVFSNAWVHQTVEAMSIALMVDPKGDPEILAAHAKFRATLEDWIPKILAAQEPDGYLQTAFTLRDPARWAERWSAQGRGNHEGYVAGYFIESAINHYMMTNKADARLYNAAKKLADCWCDNLGPAPKKEWFDGHQEMEQALVRFGRFVNQMEGGGRGDRYIRLAKFLLDSRKGGTEYDQSHVPVTQQYEAVGHAVRAVYTYSGMADVVVETRDVDYQSAVLSIWDNIVNRKYYVTGGVGSGETSEGFGPDYSLRQNAYCESCSSCGEIFFQWKLNLAYDDAKYADLYEETFYNALLGSLDLEGRNFYYDNPLDSNVPRYPWHTCPCCVGNIARTLLMLPTWMYAQGSRQPLRQPVRREHGDGGERRGHRRADGAGDRLPVEREGVAHGEPEGAEAIQPADPRAESRRERALRADAGREGHRRDHGQRRGGEAGDGAGLRRDQSRLEGRRRRRVHAPARGAAGESQRPDCGHQGSRGAAVRPDALQRREGRPGHRAGAAPLRRR